MTHIFIESAGIDEKPQGNKRLSLTRCLLNVIFHFLDEIDNHYC